MQIPLPSGRVRPEEFPHPELAEEVLKEQGWELRDLKVKFPRDRFFSRLRRPVFIPVRDFAATFADDELDAGQGKKLTLRFSLPRGAYATMVVKRLFLGEDAAISNQVADLSDSAVDAAPGGDV